MSQDERDKLCINTVRFRAVDQVRCASSGEPGLPLRAAPMADVPATRFLRRHPADPGFIHRGRVALPSGDASALVPAVMHRVCYVDHRVGRALALLGRRP